MNKLETKDLPRYLSPKSLMIFIMLISDIISLSLSLILSLLFIYWVFGVFPLEPYFRMISIIVSFFIIISMANRLYPAINMPPVEELKYLEYSIIITHISIIGNYFIFQTSIVYSKLVIVVSWVLAVILVPVIRFTIRRGCVKLGIWGLPTILVGNITYVKQIISKINEGALKDFKPVAVFTKKIQQSNNLGLPCYCFEELKNIFPLKGINVAIIATSGFMTDDNEDNFMLHFDVIEKHFKKIIFLDPTIDDNYFWLSSKKLDGMASSELKQELLSKKARIKKRMVDVVGSIFGLLFTIPVLGLIALWIKLDSSGSIFYKQKRVGKSGEIFEMIKFRTMHKNADNVLEGYLQGEPALRMEWKKFQKLKHDPRVTEAGKFLRKFSLDELPQLWNVLKGDMSLVGPRPFFPEQRKLYGEKYKKYVRVRPGITGMWQISGRAENEFTARSYWDEYYIHNWSMWLDFYILFYTGWSVTKGDGAY